MNNAYTIAKTLNKKNIIAHILGECPRKVEGSLKTSTLQENEEKNMLIKYPTSTLIKVY